MEARARRDRIELHKADLLHLLVKMHYNGVTSPSEAEEKLMDQQRKEKSAADIISDIKRKLG